MVRRQNTKKKNEWPCGACKKNCVNSCLYCAVCEKWFHSDCENVTKETLKLLSDIPEDYICVLCRSDGQNLDFLMGIERLKQAVTGRTDKLKTVLQREATFLQGQDRYVNLTPQTLSDAEVDPVADKILQYCHFQTDHKAIKSTGDGDCLFNSASILLVGDESLATELRYKTCLEMFLNKENIVQHKDRASFSCLSPTYDTALKDCARPRQYSCIWTILALSNIVKVPMDIIYPCVNGTQDLAFRKLNIKTAPENPTSEVPIKIMWASTFIPKPNKQWTPNHFVPVVPSASTVSKDNRVDFNFSFKFNQKSKSTPKQAAKEPVIIQNSPTPPRKPKPKPAYTSPPSSPYSLPSPDAKDAPFVILSPTPPRKTTKAPKAPKSTKPASDFTECDISECDFPDCDFRM